MGIRCADHVTPLYPQKLALTSPTGGGRSVGIVRSRTEATEFSLFFGSYKKSSDFSTASGISAWWRALSFELITDLHLKRRKGIKWTAVLEACPFLRDVFTSSPLGPVSTKSNHLSLQSFVAWFFPPSFVRMYHGGESETMRLRCGGDWSVDIKNSGDTRQLL